MRRRDAATGKPSPWRRVERWMVGLVMAVIALVLERLVMRSLRKKGEHPSPDPKTVTSRGGSVDFDG